MATNDKAAEESLMKLLSQLHENGYFVEENTSGLAIYRDGKKSIFTVIRIDERGWRIIRHQIRKGEALYPQIEAKIYPPQLSSQEFKIAEGKSSATDTVGVMYEIEITPRYAQLPDPRLFRELSR